MALDLSVLDEKDAPFAAAVPGVPVPGAIARAPLDAFEEDPGNPRFETNAADFDALVADVKQHGILQPLVVRREADGKLRIRFGSRRFRAAKRAGLADIPFVVTEDPRQFDDYAQVAENERRASLQPLELATFIAKKLAEGETRRAVARRLHLDPSAVTHLLALVGDVPRFVLELYHSGKCRTPQYLYELRRLSTGRVDEVARRCADAVDIDRRLLMSIAEKKPAAGAAPSGMAGNASLTTSSPSVSTPADEGRVGPADASSSPTATVRQVETTAHPSLLKPCLLAQYRQEKVRILVALRASSPARVIVRYQDGRAAEVVIAELRLLGLYEEDEMSTDLAAQQAPSRGQLVGESGSSGQG